jgi:hypothetical protein
MPGPHAADLSLYIDSVVVLASAEGLVGASGRVVGVNGHDMMPRGQLQ